MGKMKKTLTIIGSVLLTIILTVAAVFIVLFKKNNKEEKEKDKEFAEGVDYGEEKEKV